eukprot:2066674-Rhodomonas_salina.2
MAAELLSECPLGFTPAALLRARVSRGPGLRAQASAQLSLTSQRWEQVREGVRRACKASAQIAREEVLGGTEVALRTARLRW